MTPNQLFAIKKMANDIIIGSAVYSTHSHHTLGYVHHTSLQFSVKSDRRKRVSNATGLVFISDLPDCGESSSKAMLASRNVIVLGVSPIVLAEECFDDYLDGNSISGLTMVHQMRDRELIGLSRDYMAKFAYVDYVGDDIYDRMPL